MFFELAIENLIESLLEADVASEAEAGKDSEDSLEPEFEPLLDIDSGSLASDVFDPFNTGQV